MMLSLVVLLSTASAQETSSAEDRETSYAVNLRYRAAWAPNFIFDSLWSNTVTVQESTGNATYERPSVGGSVAGIEFALTPRPANFIFYIERFGIAIDEGYWDDIETPHEPRDGDWMRFEGTALWALGFNYAHEVPITSTDKDVWAALQFGAGLGVGPTTGQIEVWHPGVITVTTGGTEIGATECGPGLLATERLDCKPDEIDKLPPVLPILDLTMSARLDMWDHASLRLDFGLHNMPYVGGALGGQF